MRLAAVALLAALAAVTPAQAKVPRPDSGTTSNVHVTRLVVRPGQTVDYASTWYVPATGSLNVTATVSGLQGAGETVGDHLLWIYRRGVTIRVRTAAAAAPLRARVTNLSGVTSLVVLRAAWQPA